jgi:hypothetical protein
MIRPLFRLVLVLIAAAAIAVCAGGFSWDGPTNNVGWGASTPDTAIVAGSSVDSSGSATAVGFSWDDGSASSGAVAG